MLSKEEIKQWILKNCVDKYGNINLSHLDFSDFDGNICFFGIKTKNSLYQDYQEVNGNLFQDNQTVKIDLFQDNQTVNENLFQNNQTVNGSLIQDNKKVTGIIYQDKEVEK